MKLKSFLATFILIGAFIYLPTVLQAAPGNPGPDPDPVPLDGGLSLVIAAGIGYASKKAYDKRKKDKAARDAGE